MGASLSPAYCLVVVSCWHQRGIHTRQCWGGARCHGEAKPRIIQILLRAASTACSMRYVAKSGSFKLAASGSFGGVDAFQVLQDLFGVAAHFHKGKVHQSGHASMRGLYTCLVLSQRADCIPRLSLLCRVGNNVYAVHFTTDKS